jgi:hypothetical protein
MVRLRRVLEAIDKLRVEFVRFALDYSYGVSRAFTQTCPESIAKVIRGKNSLPVDNFDRPFGARGDTEPAAVTFFRINGYYFSFHSWLPFLPVGTTDSPSLMEPE